MTVLDDLAFFQCVARAGSLTGAARELGLSLSAVSKRLKQLEARLGVALASRSTRRLTLTAEGARYVLDGTRILDELQALETSLGDRPDGLGGRLRVNATFGFGRRHVAPLLSAFAARHPRLVLQLDLSSFPLSLADSDVDIGIRVGLPPDSRLVAQRLLPNRRILCAAPAYLARAPALHSPADLTAHDCLLVREVDSDYALWRFERAGAVRESISVKVAGRLSSNDGEAATRMALDGHGVLMRSWWDVHAHLAAGELVALLPQWHGAAADFYAVYARRPHVPARVRACIDELRHGMAGRVPPLPA